GEAAKAAPSRPSAIFGAQVTVCGYKFRIESRWLPMLLDGSTPCEDFLLSLRLQTSRDPDLYNDHLRGLLKFADQEALQAVEDFETAGRSDEWITIHSERRLYKVSRYCPHAGNDLLHTGEVLPGGILQCGAHHYDFDLNTGRCLNSACAPLKVEAIEERKLSALARTSPPCPASARRPP